MTSRLVKIGDALSQLCNVAFLPNHRSTTPNESISGRAYRMGWIRTQMVIDFIFSPFEKNHCKTAYLNDIARARKLLDEYEAKRNRSEA